MNPTDLLCIVGLIAIAIYAGREISRIESTGRARDEYLTIEEVFLLDLKVTADAAEDLAAIERDLADHGSFGRNLADRELG